VITLEHLGVTYGPFEAVRDVTLAVPPGTTTALVGESGSGKSSLALATSRLLPPGAAMTGTVRVGDVDVGNLAGDELRAARGRLVGYLAQDAMAALNPVMPAGRQVAEVFELRAGATRRAAMSSAVDLLRGVGIQQPGHVATLYPHELSGGMRQRVMIAIALALRPSVLIADEPTTALDVTVQAEILSLVRDLQRDFGLTVLWITHDMGVVAEIADAVAVMYGGRIVEHGPALDVFARTAHPYARALLDAVRMQHAAAAKEPFTVIAGQPPAGEVPPGCPFHPRCPVVVASCSATMPATRTVGADHVAACHLLS
jgi:oligopeptide/dipeptide ABC transporter ATP-binding protein